MKKQQRLTGAILLVLLGIFFLIFYALKNSDMFLWIAGAFGGFGGVYGTLVFFFDPEEN